MVNVKPVQIGGHSFVAVDVSLPKTRLLAVQAATGYIMCGALDVGLLNTRLADRRIVAARAVGVRTVEELLEAPLESVTDAARELGVVPGMRGADALVRMAESPPTP